MKIDISYCQRKIRIVGIYGPNKDSSSFFQNIFDLFVKDATNYDFILTGDFNTVLDYTRDTMGLNNQNNKKSHKIINDSIIEYCLSDVWHLKNPDIKRFTWHAKSNLKKSRLDYFLISDNLVEFVAKTDIVPGYRSDHSFVELSLNFEKKNIERGIGYWKMNTCLLYD